MKIMMGVCITLCMAIISSLSCSKSQVVPPVFNGQRAYDYLVKQVSFGPRVPGSIASQECRQFYYEHFDRLGLKVDSQAFTFFDPYSKSEIPMVNVVASYMLDTTPKNPGVVLMAHYDSRPRTDYTSDAALKNQPIAGANDGASGVAVLMEIANILASQPPLCNVDIVLVDGEDWGKVGDQKNYMLGSKEFARTGIREKYKFGFVIDMVGDKNQEIYREVLSEYYHKDLNDLVWSTAAELGIQTFYDSVKYTIQDDHLSLNAVGVPAIDIIDFDYPYWHTEFDTPDKCSAESLENVGKILTKIIYNPSIWQKK